MVGESSRVSIREHAIMFWVGRSAAACAVVIVGTCLPLVFGHHFVCAFFVFLCRHRGLKFRAGGAIITSERKGKKERKKKGKGEKEEKEKEGKNSRTKSVDLSPR